MKVLQVVPSLALRHGGVSVSVRELCSGLAGLGTEVQVWSTPRGYDARVDAREDERLKAAGVEVRYFPVSSWPWLGQRYAYSAPLGRALREEGRRFDLVHIHSLWLYPTLAAASFCRRVQIPYILSPCGALDPYSLRIRRPLKQLYGRWIERRTLRGASVIQFTSALEQRRAWSFGLNWRSVVIPCSVALEAIPDKPAARRPEWGSRKILLFLGRLHPKKRLDLVAEAFVALCRRRNDVHLVVAGPDEGSAPMARRILEEGGVLDRVTFTGFVDANQRWALLKSALIFLFPSEDENFGITALEAIALGVPVLLSDQVGLSEEVARANAGVILDLNPAAWAAAAETLLDQPDRAKAMGQAGRRLAEAKFSTQRVVSRMKELYESILSP